ncbi:helix-turn-helix domain-containing protein [Dongia rigui]|uniref:Helix-turn-helix domain-containing protein n=1 Tax=Dongia rigui TaxID=940149 RepID=A0ABU5DYV3_9PROT|nr:helix-turn-helix domain-containing protein [Dongia rigui]MDY0872413.1 helix-turn-helix domain-containing protein [Dongia rigui]
MQKTNRSLERGLILLRQLELKGPATLSALARHGDLPKATASRLLLTLVEAGWVYRRRNDGLFVATLPQAAPLAEPDRGRIARAALPYLVDLSEVTGLAADLVWVMGVGVLEVVESTRTAQIGGVDPKVAGFRPSLVFSAPGRALLAACDPATRARHLAHVTRLDSPAERLAVTKGQLANELALTKKRGYGQRAAGYWPQSSDYGREPMDIAVPIGTQGCLSLVWPAEAHEADEVAAANLMQLRETARAIGRVVGP